MTAKDPVIADVIADMLVTPRVMAKAIEIGIDTIPETTGVPTTEDLGIIATVHGGGTMTTTTKIILGVTEGEGTDLGREIGHTTAAAGDHAPHHPRSNDVDIPPVLRMPHRRQLADPRLLSHHRMSLSAASRH